MKPALHNHRLPASSRNPRGTRECVRTPGQTLLDRNDFHDA